jgi:hypothetical protein
MAKEVRALDIEQQIEALSDWLEEQYPKELKKLVDQFLDEEYKRIISDKETRRPDPAKSTDFTPGYSGMGGAEAAEFARNKIANDPGVVQRAQDWATSQLEPMRLRYQQSLERLNRYQQGRRSSANGAHGWMKGKRVRFTKDD